ncbi:amidophosphoribosyltransferase [Symbiobacterium terraclitae]|uniref:Amidophosphoribosyltransferase n=1 Tax=Symbiobacterium terraclitae TaxID=557451 RepID=A0ABS4JV94_9FIRM|nr:amidophosphoribosyltransferase [Symbiobacterium terraclitae]MBP2019451.1 amidophosphoribosyltransferase [Symbiobacterium terraclitae]
MDGRMSAPGVAPPGASPEPGRAGRQTDPTLALALEPYRAVLAAANPEKGPVDECGVFGIYGHPGAARVVYHALIALQHRGQESAGIVAADGGNLIAHRGMGLVSEVFEKPESLDRLVGDVAIGHVRYSTTGSSRLSNAQPIVVNTRRGGLALAHNGNLVNAAAIRHQLEEEGAIFATSVDTEVLVHLIVRSRAGSLEEAVMDAIAQVHGGYALLILAEDRLIGLRDPHGIRPLQLGRLDGRWVLASESCAFDTIGAEFVREVAPGEMITISEGGKLRSQAAVKQAAPPRPCIFEFIYFARPDSQLEGANVHTVRKAMGRQLAREAPAEADIVIGVPDSSISAATGYAEEAGIPYEVGLIKNRYIARTFILPSQTGREAALKLKLNPLRKVIEGKRVVLVDDSIVRGTTSRRLVSLLREAGAREVHMRIASPPYRNACHYGIDTSRSSDLIARGREVQEICDAIGADSLAFLSVEGMVQATGLPQDATRGFCLACFTGNYPVPVPEGAEKYALEGGCGDD